MPRTKKTKRATSESRGQKTSGDTKAASGAARSSTRGRGSRTDKPLIPKEELAREIATIIRYHHLTQTEAARVVGDAPSQMSLLLSGKIEGFSTERLLRMLLRLGRDIELVFRPAQNARAAKFRISHKSTLTATT
ncbi:MAG TPA: XRE family transcriptional regulator [Gemmatimonadaceae bacterium]|nr:XRE family transcriptional regulator [Gemmatimonadaceae bacterium]